LRKFATCALFIYSLFTLSISYLLIPSSSQFKKIFDQKKIRSDWSEEDGAWYFSIVDVIAILTESLNPRKYWSVLKTRLKKEGSQLATNCSQLKLLSSDGKYYKTDVADTEQLLRLIQSIPSPKAEPFKIWLAQVGAERLDEMQDPEISINRALEQYIKLGYSENWITNDSKVLKYVKSLQMSGKNAA
jgi:hypothetical protein